MKHLSLLCLLGALGACGDGTAPAPAPAAAPVPVPIPVPAPAPTPAPGPSPAASAPSTASSRIPAAFHGEWNASLPACGSGADDSRLRIEAGRVRFHESAGEVTSVTAHSDREITVVARLTGEGQSWDHTRRWRLSSDGATLEDVTDGSGPVRHRCP